MKRGPFFVRFICLVLLLFAFSGGQVWSGTSAAPLNHAGLVVRHDDGRMSFAYVSFTEDEINGIELLKRSGLDVVTISFGGLGEGVCSIDEHGCPSTDCRKRVCQGPQPDDPFWQYFRQVPSGEWKALALGASATKVRDGDLDGWSWTGTTPDLPPLTLQEVATRAGFSGENVTESATPLPSAVFRREGALLDSDDQSRSVYLGAIGLLLIAVGATGYIVVRRRQPTEDA